MSEIINGKKFLSSKEAAESFGYSSDYISKLAREAKVVAHRVGKLWFVEEDSLNLFVQKIITEENARISKLKAERIEEYQSSVAHVISRPPPVATAYGTTLGRMLVIGMGLSVFVFSFISGYQYVQYKPIQKALQHIAHPLKYTPQPPVTTNGASLEKTTHDIASRTQRAVTELKTLSQTILLQVVVPEPHIEVSVVSAPKYFIADSIDEIVPRGIQTAFAFAAFSDSFFKHYLVSVNAFPHFTESLGLHVANFYVKGISARNALSEHLATLWLDRNLIAEELLSDTIVFVRDTHTLYKKTGITLLDYAHTILAAHELFIEQSAARVSVTGNIVRATFESALLSSLHSVDVAIRGVHAMASMPDENLFAAVASSLTDTFVEPIKTTTQSHVQSFSWYDQLQKSFLSLFSTEETPPVVPVTETPASVVERIITNTPTTVINNLTERVTVTGVSYDTLTQRLEALENELRSEIYLYSARAVRGVSGNYRAIQLMNDISNLDGVTIRNATIIGGSISGTSGIGGGGASALDDLSDVTLTGAAYGNVLLHNGTTWVNVATSSLGITGSGSSFGQAFEISNGALT
ncbi:MAG: hypothetical protein AAB439_01520, partial [Patescibacteria group bacterium]